MKSFQELYCAENQCDAEQFLRRVFWQCVRRHAIPFVPFFGGVRSEYFAVDRDLIAGAGQATSVADLKGEIIDHLMDSRNTGWLRRHANIRVSTSRLRRLARRYLSADEGRSSVAAAVPN